MFLASSENTKNDTWNAFHAMIFFWTCQERKSLQGKNDKDEPKYLKSWQEMKSTREENVVEKQWGMKPYSSHAVEQEHLFDVV